jgi:versiconal hemiacetal acetate esterase
LNECYKALLWALDNLKRLNTAEGKFLTAGLSAGGQLAFATALRSLDQRSGELVGVVALIPATVHPDGVPEILQPRYTAMEEHDQHSINTAGAMRDFWGAFGAPPTDIYGSPLLHPGIKHLKKVYMAVAGQDTLRDDGALMKLLLNNAGYVPRLVAVPMLIDCSVPVRFDFYDGYPHFFFAWPSPKLHEPRKKFFEDLAEGVKYVLSE